jgi:hypothetical protein
MTARATQRNPVLNPPPQKKKKEKEKKRKRSWISENCFDIRHEDAEFGVSSLALGITVK